MPFSNLTDTFPEVKEVAFVKKAACFWLKGRILEFFSHCVGQVPYFDQSLPSVLVTDGGRKSQDRDACFHQLGLIPS
jgi:hypothetical protein